MGYVIRTMRLNKKYTLEETAEVIGSSRIEYFRKEKETKNFRVGELIKLADFLKLK
ncbi:helix-turn-helix domain-containing protein [Clostridium gasigenes]|uniref:helix-turn-helix domain-containing protein n=1 Tax=Clostridium gasigenes TaxID=94869 RepID=UPI001C0CB681|nr:helix-turn-helix transcriptional regulator [Clostridium gasigenes]MBU3109350.1 helix-turn-helix transcriptional regulator [Clostridium gasigenes]